MIECDSRQLLTESFSLANVQNPNFQLFLLPLHYPGCGAVVKLHAPPFITTCHHHIEPYKLESVAVVPYPGHISSFNEVHWSSLLGYFFEDRIGFSHHLAGAGFVGHPSAPQPAGRTSHRNQWFWATVAVTKTA